jgi:hypothetical protein
LRRLYRFIAVFITVMAVLASTLMLRAITQKEYRPDYSVFWTASHVVLSEPGRLYDSEYMTTAQSWIAAPWHGPRPYAYPPSALLAFIPFSWMAFWPSFIAWNAISLAAFASAARPFARSILLGLALLAPATVLCLISGQTALLIGAACMFGMSQLDKRPSLAGLVLGFAAAIKPQALILAPILISTQRRALASFLCGGATLVLFSFLLGPALWLDWIGAMPSFVRDVDELGLVRWGITPATLATWLRLDNGPTLALRVAGVTAGIALAFWARKRAEVDRLVALVAGAIFCSPYAMTYDMAALMPVASTALFSETFWGLLIGLPFMGFGAVTLPVMAACSVVRGNSHRRFMVGREAA